MKKYLFVLSLASVLTLGFSYTAQATVCDPASLRTAKVFFGMRGPVVLNLQLCLLENGFAIPAGATGYYGAQTRAAVKALYASDLAMPTWDGSSVGPLGRAKLAARSEAGGVITPSPTTKAGFKRVASQAEFQKYVQAYGEKNAASNAFSQLSRGMMAQDGAVPPATPSPTGAAEGSAASTPSRYSSTNVQVAGIDEPDIVKTDGKNIFISQQSWWGGIRPSPVPGGGVGVMAPKSAAMPVQNDMSSPIMPDYYREGSTLAVSAFPLSSLGIASKDIKEQGEMLLVKDKKMLVIFSQPNVVGYDISDPKKPVKKWTFTLGDNTSIITSRLKSDTIYLVTNTWLNTGSPCPIVPMLKGGVSMPVICTDIWVPNRIEPTNTLYTLTAIDPTTGNATNKLTIAGDSNNTVVSVSENNIYVTYRSQTAMTDVLIDFYSTQLNDFLPATAIARINTVKGYDISTGSKLNEVQIAVNAATAGMSADARLKFDNDVQNRLSTYLETRARDLDRSVITRIPLSTLTIAATGNIPGHLLNQFSLDEFNDDLRVAVTVGDQWGIGGGNTKNDVYVLDQSLHTVGFIKDLGLTERIYAVRFLGEEGYLVTFRQTDPFYVLDLSNRTAPRMIGQLKIPGYSSYLEPIGADMMLGVGQEGSQVKLSLFDVSNPSAPFEKSKYTLAENWTEVGNNHHAFLRDYKQDIFFLPGGNGGYVFSHINDKLTLKATVSGYSIKRAVYIDNYLYVIGDDKLAVFDENTWTKVKELSLQ